MAPFRSLSPNERLILSLLLQRESSISRAELARRTGLALQTVSRLTDQLVQDGFVSAEAKVMMGARGQPSLPLSLASDGAYAFGAAVRADQLSIALIDLRGAVRHQVDEPLVPTKRDSVGRRIAAITKALAKASGIDPMRVAGIGIALPGFFIDHPLRINAPLGMDDWVVAELEAGLARTLGLPIIAENDGNAAAVGERIFGLGRGHADFAYIYVDRGLGGGVVRGGELLRGAHGNAGEFTGLLSPSARASRPTLTLLLDLARAEGHAFAGIPDLLAAFDLAWPCVEQWLDMAGDAVEQLLSAIASVLDPELVVIGGRLPPELALRLAERARFYPVPGRGRDRALPRIAPTGVRGDAAALGAAALVFDRYLL